MAAHVIEETQPIEVSALAMVIFGPPGCISGDTFVRYEIRSADGVRQNHKGGTLERLYRRFHGLRRPGFGNYQRPQTIGSSFFIQSVDDEGRVFLNRVNDVVDSGTKDVFRVTTVSGKTLRATADHEFLVPSSGYVPLSDLRVGDTVCSHSGRVRGTGGRRKRPSRPQVFVRWHPTAGTKVIDGRYRYHVVQIHRAVYEAAQNGMTLAEYKRALNTESPESLSGLWFLPPGSEIHHRDENPFNNSIDNLVFAADSSEHQRLHHVAAAIERVTYRVESDPICEITPEGPARVYDVVVADPHRNFVAGGVVVHNCGKTSFAQTAAKPITLDFDTGVHRAFNRKRAMRFDCWRDVEAARPQIEECSTVVVDTVGRLLDLLSGDIIAGNAKHGTAAGGMSLQGYGVLKSRFALWMNQLRLAGKDVVLICHEREDKDGDDRIMRPDIQGGSYTEVHKLSDMIGYLYRDRSGRRYFDTNPSDRHLGKNAAGWNPTEVPDLAAHPTFLADLLADAKAKIGQTAEASKEIAGTVDEWKHWADSTTDIGQFNKILKDIGELKGAAKKQVWAAVVRSATARGWTFDKATKAFTAAA